MSNLPEQSLRAALRWYTDGRVPQNARDKAWAALDDRLEACGARPWSYVMFMIYYDSVSRELREAKLIRGNYVWSAKTFDRFRAWLDTNGQFVLEATHRQLNYLRHQIKLGIEPEHILLVRCIDASVMTRLEVAVECRDRLGALFDDVVDTFIDRAVEMYMGLPWYEELTPKACKLIKEWRHER